MSSDMMDTLKGLLGQDAEEKLQGILGNLKSDDNNDAEASQALESINKAADFEGAQYLMQIKNIIEKMGSANDERTNLLLSLKPYMRKERQRSIDNAVKILNLTRFSGLLGR